MISNLKFEILSEEDKNRVIDATYELMEEIGMIVQSEEGRELLAKAGARIEEDRVYIPRELVKKSIESAPDSIQIYDRNGNEAMLLGGRNSYFGPGPTCPDFMDPFTGERRVSRKEDAANTAKCADGLKHMDYVMSLTMIGDQTAELADVHEVDAMIRNTTKPVVTWAFNADNAKDLIALAETVAGGEEQLREKPFLIIYNEPTSPFIHSKDAVEKLLVTAKKHVPAMYTPGMILGGTAPVSVVGALCQGLAESLTGCVMSQLVSEGAPYIGGTSGTPMDMKAMTTPYGAPETSLLLAASNEMMHWLGLPCFDMTGSTDSKLLDAQAGLEVGQEALISLLSGGNLIHDCGFMDSGMMGSLAHLVVCDEAISLAKRYCQGVTIDDFTLDLKTMKKVGPGGNYLQTKQTVKGFKKEHHITELLERRPVGKWEEDGSKDMAQRAAEKARKILETHEVPALPDDILAKMDQIVAGAEDRVVKLKA